jgi:hypothetical protein
LAAVWSYSNLRRAAVADVRLAAVRVVPTRAVGALAAPGRRTTTAGIVIAAAAGPSGPAAGRIASAGCIASPCGHSATTATAGRIASAAGAAGRIAPAAVAAGRIASAGCIASATVARTRRGR